MLTGGEAAPLRMGGGDCLRSAGMTCGLHSVHIRLVKTVRLSRTEVPEHWCRGGGEQRSVGGTQFRASTVHVCTSGGDVRLTGLANGLWPQQRPDDKARLPREYHMRWTNSVL